MFNDRYIIINTKILKSVEVEILFIYYKKASKVDYIQIYKMTEVSNCSKMTGKAA
jgi:hypothetical protein